MPRLSAWISNILPFWNRNKRRIWRSLTVLLVAFFAAKSANLLIGYFFLPIELQSEARSGETRNFFTSGNQSLRTILDRNLFDSSPKNKTQVSPQPEIPDDREIHPSSLNIELLGTVVFRNSRYSVALITDMSNNSTRYYSLNDRIQGASIVRIERFRVILQRANRLEYIELKSAQSNIKSEARPGFSRLPAQTPKVELEEVGPGRFAIPETTVESLLSDLPSLLKQARAVPVNGPNRNLAGFRIIEIKPNSIFEKIGIQNGDIVKRVNDEDLDSLEKGMRLFTALRNEKTISIDIERNGTRLNYTYEIR